MRDPNLLLFNSLHGGSPLFKSQLEFVQRLLHHPDSPYFHQDRNTDDYAKEVNRLKAYVSQLLSSSVNRNITDKFKAGLLVLLKERLTDSYDEIYEQVLAALQDKNIAAKTSDKAPHFIDKVYQDLAAGNYIAVITSRPLEISANLEQKVFSFQKYFIQDLIESFLQPGKNLKRYRFNFPLSQYADIFWRELKKIIVTFLNAKRHDASLHNGLMKNYLVSIELLTSLKSASPIQSKVVEEVAEEILMHLTEFRYLLVFVVDAPIYSMPIIAIDPDDPINSRIYAVLDTTHSVHIHKYLQDDYTLWRLFVWDKLKTNSTDVTDIPFKPIIKK